MKLVVKRQFRLSVPHQVTALLQVWRQIFPFGIFGSLAIHRVETEGCRREGIVGSPLQVLVPRAESADYLRALPCVFRNNIHSVTGVRVGRCCVAWAGRPTRKEALIRQHGAVLRWEGRSQHSLELLRRYEDSRETQKTLLDSRGMMGLAIADSFPVGFTIESFENQSSESKVPPDV